MFGKRRKGVIKMANADSTPKNDEFWIISDADLDFDGTNSEAEVICDDLKAGLELFFQTKIKDSFAYNDDALVYKVRYYLMSDVSEEILKFSIRPLLEFMNLPHEIKALLMETSQRDDFTKTQLTDYLTKNLALTMPVLYRQVAPMEIVSRIDFELF
jgi:hypothetical protein